MIDHIFSTKRRGQYPQIRLLNGIKTKAAISLPVNCHCKAIAAVLFIPYYLGTLPRRVGVSATKEV